MCLTHLFLYEYKLFNTIKFSFTCTCLSKFIFINNIAVTTKMFVKFKTITETINNLNEVKYF